MDIEMMAVYWDLMEIIERTNTMDQVSFGSLYCMMAEEWCRTNQVDVVEFIHTISDMVEKVNAEEGRY